MASDTSLVFNILAKDKATAAFGKVESTIGRLGVAVAGMAAAAGVGLVKVGMDFDKAFDTIAVGTGKAGADLEGLKTDFKEALADTPADMATVSSAIADLNTMTGATGKVLQDLTVGVTEASRVLGEDGTANAKAFGQSLQQWQIPAAEGSNKLDALFKATQDYGVGLGDIISQLNVYGSVLQNADFTMEESAALFGQLNKAGLDVSRVMPGLNMAFRTWAEEGKNVQDQLGKTVKKIADAKTGTAALKIATEAFGAEGAQRMTTAIRSGAVSLDDLSSALGGAEGLIAETAAGTDSWQEKLQRLKNEGLVAIEPIASAVFDKLSEGVGVLKNVTKWAQNNTGTVKALGIALGGIAATIVAVNVGLKVYHGIQMVIRAATIAWTAVQWLLNVAMTANPIGLVIVAIGALIGIIVLIATKTNWFQNIWKVVWTAIKNVISWWWENVVVRYFQALKFVWQKIVAGVKAVWHGIKLYFGFWKGMLERVVGWVVGLWNGARNNLQKILSFAKSLPGRILNALGNLRDLLFSAGKNVILGLIDGIRNMVGNAAQAAKDAVGSAVDAAKDFLGIGSPSRVFMQIGMDTMRGYQLGIKSQAEPTAQAIEVALQPGLRTAVLEMLRAVQAGKQFFEDFTFRGMSDFAKRFNDHVARAFHESGREFTRRNVEAFLEGFGKTGGRSRASRTSLGEGFVRVEDGSIVSKTFFSTGFTDKQRAALEMLKAVKSGKRFFEDFTFKGISDQAKRFRKSLADDFFASTGLGFGEAPDRVMHRALVKFFNDVGLGKFDEGGLLPTGMSIAVNNTGKPERVLGPDEKIGRGPTINVHVQGSIRSDRDLVEVIRNEFLNGGFRGVLEGAGA